MATSVNRSTFFPVIEASNIDFVALPSTSLPSTHFPFISKSWALSFSSPSECSPSPRHQSTACMAFPYYFVSCLCVYLSSYQHKMVNFSRARIAYLILKATGWKENGDEKDETLLPTKAITHLDKWRQKYLLQNTWQVSFCLTAELLSLCDWRFHQAGHLKDRSTLELTKRAHILVYKLLVNPYLVILSAMILQT